jgi:nitrogen regulatory protein P-II 1
LLVFLAKTFLKRNEKGYLTAKVWLSVKEISIFVPTEDLEQVAEILKKHKVGGMTFYQINGAGRTKREALPEMVRSYMTGRMITPDYAKRIKVETIVSDSLVNQILEDISNSIGQHAGNEAHGMIFIKDVYDAYEIGTRQRGEAVLASK